MVKRTIVESVTGSSTMDGAGVKLVRVLGNRTVRDFDPFLMLDAFDSTNPSDYVRGFPLHPHRGIETFTYLMRGEIAHEDSLGNKGTISDGCCQWMTAGSGILHQEMPQATDRLLGLQLWINLPRAHKMTAPKYRDIRLEHIPVVDEKGVSVSVVAGNYQNAKGQVSGPAQGDYAKIDFFDARMEPEVVWTIPTRPDDTVFAYLVQGSVSVEGKESPARHALLFSHGDSLEIKAGSEGARLVLVAGKALEEPIAWGGPIVMNTEEELRQAFQDLEDDKFLKHR